MAAVLDVAIARLRAGGVLVSVNDANSQCYLRMFTSVFAMFMYFYAVGDLTAVRSQSIAIQRW